MGITVVSAVTLGTLELVEMCAENRRRVEKLGYKYMLYPLQPGKDLEGDLPPCTFKPEVIGKALAELPIGETVVWMDADAIMVGHPLLELPGEKLNLTGGMPSVAVTLRDVEEIGASQPRSNYLNAGVIFFCNTERVRKFVAVWSDLAQRMGNDQWALSVMVAEGLEDWKTAHDTRVWLQSERIWCQILRAGEWNSWYHDRWKTQIPPPRVLHFKSGFRRVYGPTWWKRVLEDFPA